MTHWEVWAIGVPVVIVIGLFLLRMFLVWDAKRRARRQGFYCYPGFVHKNYSHRPNTRKGSVAQ